MYNENRYKTIPRLFPLQVILGILLTLLIAGCAGSKKKTQPVAEPEPLPPAPVVESAPAPTPPTPQPEPAMPKVALVLKTIYFDFDKSDLRPDALRTLEENVRVLQAYPDVKILLEGHCDERGTVEYNLALGDRRANSVRAFLVSRGILDSRISTVSYGKERPVDPRRTEEAYAKNRRVEFVIREGTATY